MWTQIYVYVCNPNQIYIGFGGGHILQNDTKYQNKI